MRKKVDLNVALCVFTQKVKTAYRQHGLDLPEQVYITDSFAEEQIGVPGVRFHSGSSDLDILFPEPDLSIGQVRDLEMDIRNMLTNTGVDFAFAPQEELGMRNGYGRIAVSRSMNWE